MKRILIVDDVPGWIRFHQNNIEYLKIPDIEIDTASCAKDGLSEIMKSISKPYDVIFTDLQMESDFLPKYAGEWFIEQIKTFKQYENSKIVIISATPSIKRIAEKYGVQCLSKTLIRNSDAIIYKNFIM